MYWSCQYRNEAGIFKCFCFIWKLWIIRWVSITISDLTHSIKQPCGRCFDIKFMTVYSPQFQMLLNLYWEMWKTLVKACKLLKSLSKKPWGSSKEILLNYYFSCLMREVKILFMSFSFSVYFQKFWRRPGGISFYRSHKGNEGADTDLVFQFCLPYRPIPVWNGIVWCGGK
mgnify:CR=1 FL=1